MQPSLFFSLATNNYSLQKPNIYHQFVPFLPYRINRNTLKYPTYSVPPRKLSMNYSRQRLGKSIDKHLTFHQNINTPNPSLIFINTAVNGSHLRAMIDTGATHSFITQRALSKLYHSAVPSCDCIAQLGDGHTVLTILGEVQLLLQFDRVFTPLNVLVVKTMNTDFILGSDWCTENAARIDYDQNQVSIRSPNGRIFIPYDRCIDSLTLDVKSINVLHIPPRESCAIQAKVELSSADTVYFSPVDIAEPAKSIVMSPSLLQVNN